MDATFLNQVFKKGRPRALRIRQVRPAEREDNMNVQRGDVRCSQRSCIFEREMTVSKASDLDKTRRIEPGSELSPPSPNVGTS